MSKKGKNSGKGGQGAGRDDSRDHDDAHVLEYTPDATFNIRHSASEFAQWMEETGLPLLLHLPHVTVEFEAGCTPKEIIDGYFYAMQRKTSAKPSNCNLPTATV